MQKYRKHEKNKATGLPQKSLSPQQFPPNKSAGDKIPNKEAQENTYIVPREPKSTAEWDETANTEYESEFNMEIKILGEKKTETLEMKDKNPIESLISRLNEEESRITGQQVRIEELRLQPIKGKCL